MEETKPINPENCINLPDLPKHMNNSHIRAGFENLLQHLGQAFGHIKEKNTNRELTLDSDDFQPLADSADSKFTLDLDNFQDVANNAANYFNELLDDINSGMGEEVNVDDFQMEKYGDDSDLGLIANSVSVLIEDRSAVYVFGSMLPAESIDNHDEENEDLSEVDEDPV
ncbi:hypothetical protein Ciccas_008016 [Cichlidogyrus casuarinus]|uniref:Uncharacterized protein n=1 Tax=Cichlidogyrus casuarinus TaxID=1844966 RepID=A0ABD2Q168_9PLAT